MKKSPHLATSQRAVYAIFRHQESQPTEIGNIKIQKEKTHSQIDETFTCTIRTTWGIFIVAREDALSPNCVRLLNLIKSKQEGGDAAVL